MAFYEDIVIVLLFGHERSLCLDNGIVESRRQLIRTHSWCMTSLNFIKRR